MLLQKLLKAQTLLLKLRKTLLQSNLHCTLRIKKPRFSKRGFCFSCFCII